MDKIPCTVGILTLNSEAVLARCLESVKDFAEILILDGNSTDRTREIAVSHGARVEKQMETDEPNVRIQDFAAVRNKMLGLAKQPWFFDLDSDEYISPGLATKIRELARVEADGWTAYSVPRVAIVNGKLVRHAFFYPDRYTRLYKPSAGYHFHPQKKVHEKLIIPDSCVVEEINECVYAPWKTVEEMKGKNTAYLKIVADKMADKGTRNTPRLRWMSAAGAVRNAARSFQVRTKSWAIAQRYPREECLPSEYVNLFSDYHLQLAWMRFKAIFA